MFGLDGSSISFADLDGATQAAFDGHVHRYAMTFDADKLPPVRNHWELPIHDSSGHFVANEIDRYSLNSYMPDRGKHRVDEGRLTVHIHESCQPTQARPATGCGPQTAPLPLRRPLLRTRRPLIDSTYPMPPVVPSG